AALFPCARSRSWDAHSSGSARSVSRSRRRRSSSSSLPRSAACISRSDTILRGTTVAKQSSSAADRRAQRGARATPSGLRAQKGDESMAPALDKIIHERIRLGIVSALAVNERLTFNELKQLLHTSDGNVSVHARKLEDAGYLACTKSF